MLPNWYVLFRFKGMQEKVYYRIAYYFTLSDDVERVFYSKFNAHCLVERLENSVYTFLLPRFIYEDSIRDLNFTIIDFDWWDHVVLAG